MDSNKLEVTDQDLIVVMGGHARPGLGSQQHSPIFRDSDGNEFVFSNPQTPFTPVPIEHIQNATRREKRQ